MTRIKFSFEHISANAMALLAAWRAAARRQGISQEEIERITAEAKSKDYDHLLGVLIDHSTDESREPHPSSSRSSRDLW